MKTNTKAVRNLVRKHIHESVLNGKSEKYPDIETACREVRKGFDVYRASYRDSKFSSYLYALPFNFLFTCSDINSFLNGLGINPTGREFSCEKSSELYALLILKEIK